MRHALLPLPLLLAGCVAQASPGHSLAETEWRFVSIDGEAAVSDKAMLSFQGKAIGANVGCNGMGGEWKVKDRRLVAGPLMQTEMFCEGPVWAQEQATSALLVAAPEIMLEGGHLRLTSRGHFAELTRISPPPQKQ